MSELRKTYRHRSGQTACRAICVATTTSMTVENPRIRWVPSRSPLDTYQTMRSPGRMLGAANDPVVNVFKVEQA